MRIVHLMASPFFGGPERQMLGLARHLPKEVESVFLSFAERGLAQPFMDEVKRHGIEGKLLAYNTPRFFACVREVANELTRLKADVLCTSGYKPDIVGWRAARRAGVPIVCVSHGWTAATWKVRWYESLDRWVHRRMDAVVCVSQAQAEKVRAAEVPEEKIVVIQNAVGEDAFLEPQIEVGAEMVDWFITDPRWIIGAVGRLSPEKGFANLVEAAAIVIQRRPEAGFILFGEGPLRADLEKLIEKRSIKARFILAGFRSDVQRYLPNLDLGVMSSYTEGLPITLLEIGAAGVPTVATAVGGIPEVIEDGRTGFLVPPGDSNALAQRIVAMLDNDRQRAAMGLAARERVRNDFSFATTGPLYLEVFQRVLGRSQ